MMVMAAALAKLILPSVMMASKFWWRATTWQSDDWFQVQGTVKRKPSHGHEPSEKPLMGSTSCGRGEVRGRGLRLCARGSDQIHRRPLAYIGHLLDTKVFRSTKLLK